MNFKGSFFFMIAALSGCSNQQIYENIQANQRQECRLLPKSQIEDCLAKYQQSYADYLWQKDQIASEKQNR